MDDAARANVIQRPEEDAAHVPCLRFGVRTLVDDAIEQFATLEELGNEPVFLDGNDAIVEGHYVIVMQLPKDVNLVA